MGKKYLIINGKQVDLDANEPLLKKKLGESVLSAIMDNLAKNEGKGNEEIGFGAIIEYSIDSAKRLGKVTGYNKNNKKLVVSKVASQSKAGFSFSSTETDEVALKDVIRRVNL